MNNPLIGKMTIYIIAPENLDRFLFLIDLIKLLLI